MHSYGDDDTLNGDKGNDYLDGGKGDDTYLFDSDFGKDTIDNQRADSSDNDIAKFNGIDYRQLWFSKSGNDLKITVAGTDNQVIVKNWYNHADNQLDSIEAGGLTLLNSQVDQLVNAMAAYNVPLGVGQVIPQQAKDDLKTVLVNTWG